MDHHQGFIDGTCDACHGYAQKVPDSDAWWHEGERCPDAFKAEFIPDAVPIRAVG